MRTKFLAAALVASSALAAPAFAQDANPGFTGPRVEAVVGWDHVSDASNKDLSRDGVVYGGQVGYDFQSGGTVFGVEGEVTGASTKMEANNVVVPGDSMRVKAGRDLYVGGRIGFIAGDRTLIYAKGGYTNARLNADYVSGATTVSTHENADGWRLGAGAEMKVNDKVYVKGEYRYSKYDDDNSGIDARRHQVVAGVGVRF